MSEVRRVVFDCNVFLQALAKPTGPAGRCVSLALEGKVALFISEQVLDEIRDVTTRPELISHFKLRLERVQTLINTLPSAAVLVKQVPIAWIYQRDPDDAHYVNLALAAKASLIVSRDNDLLDLMDHSRAESREFHQQFPFLRVMNPAAFISIVEVKEGDDH
jgi:putative PIN family toxin of toxin-antitoxin system